jgi:hypothetical protein
MGFTNPDSAPQAPGQMAGAPNSGPAPVPYSGADQSPIPADYGLPLTGFDSPGGGVMAGVSGNAVQEAGYAHDLNAGLCTPYYGGAISPIDAMGDADAGGRDDVADSVAGAVAAAEARFREHQADAATPGPSHIGDFMTLPPNPLDPGVGSLGLTDPSGAFYDPPRSYGP